VDRNYKGEGTDKRANGDQVLCANGHEITRRARSASEKAIDNRLPAGIGVTLKQRYEEMHIEMIE
jgi:hypothetical protein